MKHAVKHIHFVAHVQVPTKCNQAQRKGGA